MTYVLPLKSRAATLGMVGGKGASLSKLIDAGLPVPDGFHVTTDGYRLFVEENGLGSKIDELLKGTDPSDTVRLETVSQSIRDVFNAGYIPQELKCSIASAYQGMDDAAVAVRSSATAEDLPSASFAGQQDTYLNIRGEEEVLCAIKRCWASLWTARAISYRLLHNITQKSIALAVVVQRLVFSDAAGVMFTANPLSGSRGELVINAAWGLGEAVVSSLVTPDTAVVEKSTGHIRSLKIADKKIMTVRTVQGTKEVPVTNRLRKKSALTKGQIKNLANLGRRIEHYYKRPMDVEWALEKGKLFIVQARPITMLPVEWKPPQKHVIYTKGSLAEHLPSPVSPLFATLGLKAINHAAELLWIHMFGNSAKKLLPHSGAYTIINGYVYFSCHYRPLLIMAKSFTPRSLQRTFCGSVARYESARRQFEAVVEKWEMKQLGQMNSKELLKGINTIWNSACTYFTAIQLCLPAASMSETLFVKLCGKTALRNGISDPSYMLLGYDTVSLNSEKILYEIAMWVRESSVLKEYVEQHTAKELEEDLVLPTVPSGVPAKLWTEWKERLVQYHTKFGRTCYEYDFSHPTPQEVLTPTLELLKTYIEDKRESPVRRQQESVKRRDHAITKVMNNTNGLHRWLFTKLLLWSQATAPMREDAIYHMGMGHPLIRRMLQELSFRLAAANAIQEPNDIYLLQKKELEELLTCLDTHTPLRDMSGVVKSRKKVMIKYERYTPPHIIPERYDKATVKDGKIYVRKDGKQILRGIGTSGGTVTAPACILHSPADFERFRPGSVLVAVTTTPAWTPLFSNASAIITDIGGPLSHSSIVAREYGIPAVMAVHSATRSIQDGQIITVDGGSGEVVLHK